MLSWVEHKKSFITSGPDISHEYGGFHNIHLILKDLRLRAEEQMTEYKKEMKEYLDGLTTEEKNQIQKEKATKKKIRLMKRIRKVSRSAKFWWSNLKN